MTYRPEDQRQVLRLMILAKNAPRSPTPSMIEAHQAAVPALTEMVSVHQEPADHEMLGMCHVVLGNEDSASTIFRAGLALERDRNPGSDLCGELMKRISMIGAVIDGVGPASKTPETRSWGPPRLNGEARPPSAPRIE